MNTDRNYQQTFNKTESKSTDFKRLTGHGQEGLISETQGRTHISKSVTAVHTVQSMGKTYEYLHGYGIMKASPESSPSDMLRIPSVSSREVCARKCTRIGDVGFRSMVF